MQWQRSGCAAGHCGTRLMQWHLRWCLGAVSSPASPHPASAWVPSAFGPIHSSAAPRSCPSALGHWSYPFARLRIHRTAQAVPTAIAAAEPAPAALARQAAPNAHMQRGQNGSRRCYAAHHTLSRWWYGPGRRCRGVPRWPLPAPPCSRPCACGNAST